MKTYTLAPPSNEVSLFLTNWFLDMYYAGNIQRQQLNKEKLFANFAYLALTDQEIQIPEHAYAAMKTCCLQNLKSPSADLKREAKVIYEWLTKPFGTGTHAGAN